MLKMQTPTIRTQEADRKMWFSMWFLASIVTFGLAFFPMFHRLIEGRNRHFRREGELEKQIVVYLKKQGKEPPEVAESAGVMNAKAWAASIVLVVPVFVIAYLLSRDLAVHEKHQDSFLAGVFSERIFMPQTIPIKTYALITIVTLGVGVVYWLYKVVNLYNAHFKAELQVEKELVKLMEDESVV